MAESEAHIETIDPRVRRTRQMLHDGLAKLLSNKDFDKISVQEIADAAGLHRATFYDHYPDKLALLECLVGARFHALISQRNVNFDSCEDALKAIARGVCDYLESVPGMGCGGGRQLESHMESAVIAVVRRMILDGLKRRLSPAADISVELVSATASWGIYGAAREWIQTPSRCATEKIVNQIARLVAPILHHL